MSAPVSSLFRPPPPGFAEEWVTALEIRFDLDRASEDFAS